MGVNAVDRLKCVAHPIELILFITFIVYNWCLELVTVGETTTYQNAYR